MASTAACHRLLAMKVAKSTASISATCTNRLPRGLRPRPHSRQASLRSLIPLSTASQNIHSAIVRGPTYGHRHGLEQALRRRSRCEGRRTLVPRVARPRVTGARSKAAGLPRCGGRRDQRRTDSACSIRTTYGASSRPRRRRPQGAYRRPRANCQSHVAGGASSPASHTWRTPRNYLGRGSRLCASRAVPKCNASPLP